MLLKILNENLVYASYDAMSWSDAIAFGGYLLERNSFITNEYTEAMISVVNDLGAYIVIAPGIALAHAKPGVGVNKVGVSIVSLLHPIEFGHKENDPVKVVICLAALNNDSHLELLKEIVNILMKDEFISRVSTAKNRNDIMNIFLEKQV